ncbi:MAG: dienelactone hydrolase family protein [Acidobacteriia bacterium]|nr:dienelactone hydrolase family protein [Terriglobia bacterium]
MDRMKASDFPKELLDEFHQYVHGDLDRRSFIERCGKYVVGGMTAMAIFEALKPNYAFAQQVSKDDKRIVTEYQTLQFIQGNGKIKGYLVRPAAASATAKVPAVLVVHENRGLNPYIEDVARRLGTENFMAFAPDGLTTVGGYPGNDEQGGALFAKVDRAKMTDDFGAAANWLRARPESTGRLGAIGFCFGGGVVNTLAVRMGSNLAAAVPFYGSAPKAEDVATIKAAVLVHHGELDAALAAGWPAYNDALTAAGVPHEGYIYPGANHGFFNDTTPRYDAEASKLAWTRTLAWFNKYLRNG